MMAVLTASAQSVALVRAPGLALVRARARVPALALAPESMALQVYLFNNMHVCQTSCEHSYQCALTGTRGLKQSMTD